MSCFSFASAWRDDEMIGSNNDKLRTILNLLTAVHIVRRCLVCVQCAVRPYVATTTMDHLKWLVERCGCVWPNARQSMEKRPNQLTTSTNHLRNVHQTVRQTTVYWPWTHSGHGHRIEMKQRKISESMRCSLRAEPNRKPMHS